MMISEYVDQLVDQVSVAQEQGEQLARALHKVVLQGGDGVRSFVDVLHGTWLGHPLHPVLTDVVVGSWSLATLFDLMSLRGGSRQAEKTADSLTTIGVVAAVPTALSGLADYSTIRSPAAGTGLMHALLNVTSLALYLLSLRARQQEQRNRGILLSTLGLIIATVSAYLGGHLVFKQRVGVNHNESTEEPENWTAVLDEGELREREPKRVEVKDNAVLLYRQGNQIYAVGAVCPHAGGPLEKGKFNGRHVQCPWHDSVFDLSDGRIVHGPTTYPVPNYDVRTRNGKIEVRMSRERVSS